MPGAISQRTRFASCGARHSLPRDGPSDAATSSRTSLYLWKTASDFRGAVNRTTVSSHPKMLWTWRGRRKHLRSIAGGARQGVGGASMVSQVVDHSDSEKRLHR